MAGERGAVIRQVDRLFRIGTMRAVPDGQLLERFVARRDGGEAAFETLVERHGPMVLGVCRQILPSPHDAEDAFQATFLVLVRRGSAIRKGDSLGPWLHGVARRIAVRTKADAARRRLREGERVFRVVGGSGGGDDLVLSLHDEIARLPEKYRSPIVLCDLEGHTHAEAAERLQWPIGTVSGRLSRAREILRGKIARRGLALSVGLGISALTKPLRAAVPSDLARSTAIAATRFVGSAGASPFKLLLAGPFAAAFLVAASVYATFAETGVPTREIRQATSHASVRPDAKSVAWEPRATDLRSDPAEVTSLAWSSDGRLLAAGCRDATITVWDLHTGLETMTLSGHTAPIFSLAFMDEGGRTLASSAEDYLVTLWDVPSGRPLISASVYGRDFPVVLGPGPNGSARGGLGRG